MKVIGLAVYLSIIFSKAFTCVICRQIKSANQYPVESKIKEKVIALYDVLFERNHLIARLSVVIIFCWIPYLLACWPGIYGVDSAYQLHYLASDDPINSKHSIIHTLLMSLPMMASKEIMGSYDLGFLVYTIIQVIFLAICFAGSLAITSKWSFMKPDGGKYLELASLLFLSLFPTLALHSVIATKDVLFAGLITLCTVYFADYVLSKVQGKGRCRKTVALWILLFLALSFRNNAIYGLGLFTIIVLIMYAKEWRKILPFFLSVMVAQFIVFGPFLSLFGVAPGSMRESMSIPAVQLSRVASSSSELTDFERDFIEKYVPDWDKYNEAIADSVKNSFAIDQIYADPLSFAKGYLSIGFSHPGDYMNAFLRISIGFWCPIDYTTGVQPQGGMSPWYLSIFQPSSSLPEDENVFVQNDTKYPFFWNVLQSMQSKNIEAGLPGIASLFQPGFWAWLILFYLALCIYQKRRRFAIPAIFILCYLVSIMLGPVSLVRYALPLFSCAPVFVMLIYYAYSENSGISQKLNTP